MGRVTVFIGGVFYYCWVLRICVFFSFLLSVKASRFGVRILLLLFKGRVVFRGEV